MELWKDALSLDWLEWLKPQSLRTHGRLLVWQSAQNKLVDVPGHLISDTHERINDERQLTPDHFALDAVVK